jgi:hypothetical protein
VVNASTQNVTCEYVTVRSAGGKWEGEKKTFDENGEEAQQPQQDGAAAPAGPAAAPPPAPEAEAGAPAAAGSKKQKKKDRKAAQALEQQQQQQQKAEQLQQQEEEEQAAAVKEQAVLPRIKWIKMAKHAFKQVRQPSHPRCFCDQNSTVPLLHLWSWASIAHPV